MFLYLKAKADKSALGTLPGLPLPYLRFLLFHPERGITNRCGCTYS